MTAETHTPEQYVIPTPDGKQATLVRTWTNAQIVRMLQGALEIIEQLDPPDDLRQAVFASALNLTGQMAPKQSGIAVATPMAAFENGGR